MPTCLVTTGPWTAAKVNLITIGRCGGLERTTAPDLAKQRHQQPLGQHAQWPVTMHVGTAQRQVKGLSRLFANLSQQRRARRLTAGKVAATQCDGGSPRYRSHQDGASYLLGFMRVARAKPPSARSRAKSTFCPSPLMPAGSILGQLLCQSQSRFDRTASTRYLDQMPKRRITQRSARSGQQ